MDEGGWTGVDWETGPPPCTKGVEVSVVPPSSKDRFGLLRNCEGLNGMVFTGVTFWGVDNSDSLCSCCNKNI